MSRGSFPKEPLAAGGIFVIAAILNCQVKICTGSLFTPFEVLRYKEIKRVPVSSIKKVKFYCHLSIFTYFWLSIFTFFLEMY
jgi:hypothetical protein